MVTPTNIWVHNPSILYKTLVLSLVMRTEATDTECLPCAQPVFSLLCPLISPWVCLAHAHCPGKDTGAQGDDAACLQPRVTTGQSQGWSGASLSPERAFIAIKQTTSKNRSMPFLPPDMQNRHPFGKLCLDYLDYFNMYVSEVFYRSSIRPDVRTEMSP